MTTTRCSAWSPAPTSPAVSTPATRRSCAWSAEGRRSRAWRSAPRWATATCPASDAGSSTSSPTALTQDVIYQIGALQAFARVAGSRVSYVKPHGALYNAIVHHEEQAAAVVEAIVDLRPGAAGARAARARLAAPCGGGRPDDRHARPSPTAPTRPRAPSSRDGCRELCSKTLRRSPGAASRSPPASRSATWRAAPCASPPGSICVHGDTAGAVGIARRVREALAGAGITLAPFVT